MMMGREKIASTAQEIAAHLQIVDHIKALQQGQKEIVDSMAELSDRLREMEAGLRAIKAETMLETAKETQRMLHSVQGGFYDRITDLTVQVDRLERQASAPVGNGGSNVSALIKPVEERPTS
jgi:Asp-tRNA(Asn)/Glu-tRNA(Gln) amidotransferase C subunit